MSRSVKKGPFVQPTVEKVQEMNEAGKKSFVKTWSRSSHHLPGVRRPHLRRS